MTRKKYIGKIQRLTLAMARVGMGNKDIKIGDRLRYARDHARMAAEVYGSYSKAWDSEPIMWVREHCGVD